MFLLMIQHSGGATEALDYTSWDDLVREAADFEAGEYRGDVAGAVEVTISGGRVTHTTTRADLNDAVYAELRSRPEWRRAQASAERWSDR